VGKAKTAHNRPVYASPPVGGSAPATARSIASLIPTPLLRHSLPALEMLRISLSGPPNRHRAAGLQQPERYVPYDSKNTVFEKLLELFNNFSY
jgi:hypothetical protein